MVDSVTFSDIDDRFYGSDHLPIHLKLDLDKIAPIDPSIKRPEPKKLEI
jgi:hypothetical protein